MYWEVKAFDCQDMPDDIRSLFFSNNPDGHNDTYVSFCVNRRGEDLVSDWLLDNGATPDETVMIKFWW